MGHGLTFAVSGKLVSYICNMQGMHRNINVLALLLVVYYHPSGLLKIINFLEASNLFCGVSKIF